MICPKCGANINDDSVFCINCGSNLKEVQNEVPVGDVNQGVQPTPAAAPVVEQPVISPTPFVQPEPVVQPSVEEPPSVETNNIVQPEPVVNQPTNETNNNLKTKSNSKVKLIIIIVVAVLLLGGIGFGIFKIFGSKGGQENVESLFDTNSLIPVKKDGKYGYINTEGKFVIDAVFTKVSRFYGDYAVVTKDVNGETTSAVIDKKGNVKIAIDTYYPDIDYYEDYDLWVIDDRLYSGNLKKLTSDDIEIKDIEDGFIRWKNEEKNEAGIMNLDGKITYTYKFKEGESSFSFGVSNHSDKLKDQYCQVSVEDLYGIVNCNTGKVIVDYTEQYIYEDSYNVFRFRDESFNLVKYIYIQDDKIVYDSKGSNVYVYGYDGYISISTYDENYHSQYSYIDTSSGLITSEKPKTNSSNSNDEWEEYTNSTKFECHYKYGLLSGMRVLTYCDWDKIEYLDLKLYKYLSSHGREYAYGKKDDKYHIIDLKTGKSIAEFNTSSIKTDKSSTFITYEIKDTEEKVVYSLMTQKSMSFKKDDNILLYSNYFVHSKDKKYYYNSNMKLIYTE